METLYRKYRSQTFAELVGQTQVTQILRNAIRRGRLSHAYLFCGPRGTGKTSVARIFAKALCCLNPVDGDCCGVCTNCVQIATGNALDVQEIDAASKNKVDDIRELRDRVGYAPAQFPYKIYIIDEVHMVTTAGFNALLKTLEEPPAHVKFLLCTTEPHKLPVTILSRCIRLDFTRIALPDLGVHLQWIAGQEGFILEDDAALELAALAEGSARDAISLLDQLTVYCEGTIARQDVRELFQLGDPDLVPSVVEAIRTGQQRELLDTWERLAGQGADAGRFLLQVADALKQRYLDGGEAGWRRALEAIWQGLNLLKQESFPALLVELSLLAAADSFAAPAAAPAAETAPARGAPADLRRAGPGTGAPAAGPVGDDAATTPAKRPEFQVRRTEPARSAPAELRPPAEEEAQSRPPVRRATEPPAEPPMNPRPAVVVRDEPLPPPSAEWAQFLTLLNAENLPAYALVADYVQGVVQHGELQLAYAPDRRWARQACAFAQFPELLAALSAAAQQAYGSPRIALGIAGEAASWKRPGEPGNGEGPPESAIAGPPAAPSAPDTPVRQSLEARLQQKRGGRSAGTPPELDTTPELRPDFPDAADFGPPPHPRPDPQALEDSAERLGTQLDHAATGPSDGPPTMEEVIELFGGTILPDGE